MSFRRDVIAVGASAGGVEALRTLAAGLPGDLPAAVLVVLHVPRDAPSALPTILSRSGPLPAHPAVDGELLLPGRIYVASSDHHLLVLEDRVRLSHGPAENGHRPAVDPLLRSVARAYGPRAIAVVLSGSRDDGAAGAAAVAAAGGTVVIQDPVDALHPSMPQAVCAHTEPDHVRPAAGLGALLAGLVTTAMDEKPQPEHDVARLTAEVAISDFAPITADELLVEPAGYGCPSCGGALFEVGTDATIPRYRCRIGHAWSPESLLGEQAVATEGALWTALRALEEKAALSKRVARKPGFGQRYDRMAEDAEEAGALIRQLIDRIAGRADEPAGPGGVA